MEGVVEGGKMPALDNVHVEARCSNEFLKHGFKYC